jgi:hypothetical protein
MKHPAVTFTAKAIALAAFSIVGLAVCQPAQAVEATAASASAAGAPALVRLPIGMNLTSINDYSRGFPFKNLMWGARPWRTKNLDGSGPENTGVAEKFPCDAEGYPLEVPFQPEGAVQPQTIYTIIPNVTGAGRYVVLYDGEGEITAAMSSKLISSAPGRVVLQLAGRADDSAYEGIAIKRSQKGNHIRNLRILAEADEKADLAANPFRDDFLNYCKQWHALRFMDWMASNNSLEKEWRNRKQTTFYTMVGASGDAIGRWGNPPSKFILMFSGGVPVEIMIQLANLTQTDPWFCMPHRATPEYMAEFAKLVKARLDPKLKVYVEYSNEVWNWQFQQAGWMLQSKIAGDAVIASGLRAWKNGVEPPLPYDDGTVAKEGGENHPERMAALDRRCFAAWESVFTGKDRARLVRVVAVQHSWTDTARRTAKWVMEHGGADALATGAYIAPNKEIYARWTAAGAKLTAEQVIADMNEAFEKDSSKRTREIAAIAKQYKLSYVVYEGGQHIQPEGQKEASYMPALKAAQFSQGMYDLYLKNFALHQQVGCELFCAFSSIGRQGERWGSWGHQEYYGQPRSEIPKFGALLDANTPKP